MRLAVGERAGRFARESARTAQLEVARANLPLLGALFVLTATLPIVGALALPDAVRGLVIGAGLANAVWTTYWFVAAGSGSTSKMQGADAAGWTSDALRRLRKRGWRTVDELTLDGRSDIDHVAVGPPGVYAVETKWSSSRFFDRGNRPTRILRSHIEQAARGADLLRTRLARAPIALTPRVSAVLVLWGRHAPETERVVDGVAVVPGRTVASFFERQSGTTDPLTLDRIADALTQLDRDAEGSRRPTNRYVTAGFFGIAADVLFGLLGGTMAMLLLFGMWDRLDLPAYAFVAGCSLAVGVVAMSIRYLRVAAVGWTVGSIGVLLLLTIAVAADVVGLS